MTSIKRGTTPAAAERDDAAYLDFVEGLRSFTTKKVAPVMTSVGQAALGKNGSSRSTNTLEHARDVLDPLTIVASRNRLMRSTQEMKWVGISETYGKIGPELRAALDAADTQGPGSVQYDPDFAYPDYFRQARFHLQPGGYAGDSLAGYYYHYGTKVFFTGSNDDDDLQRGLVAQIPLPQNGIVRRALDLGCSAGQSATALKERFPDAEVWGIDISAPMVRYSHKRAVDLGLDVNFAQQAAEKLNFPANHFDIVFAFILFHELPVDIGRKVVKEACRVLRPGGVFTVVDFANRPEQAASVPDYVRHFDTNNNGERYASDFVYSDFDGAFRAAGFSRWDMDAVPGSWLPIRVGVK